MSGRTAKILRRSASRHKVPSTKPIKRWWRGLTSKERAKWRRVLVAELKAPA